MDGRKESQMEARWGKKLMYKKDSPLDHDKAQGIMY